MRIHFIAFLGLFINILSGQNYQTVDEVNDACSQLGFSSNEEAQIAVDEILDHIGLFRNFIIRECPNINNAIAKNFVNESGITDRYILYDNEFFNRIDEKAGTYWAAISILAHEIGHHLNGHSLNNQGSNHKIELEADYFSGRVLAKMGATLEEAQSAIQTLKYEKATSTHPAKSDRLKEIEKGWNKSMGIVKVISEGERIQDLAYSFYRQGEVAYQVHNFKEALEHFNKAKDLGNADAYFYLSNIYYAGMSVQIDNSKAYKFAKKGYEMGSIPSTYQLAFYLFNGIGVTQNMEEGARLFKKDFQIKWFKDQFKKYKTPFIAAIIGEMYRLGYGGAELDTEIAVYWYRQAAETNDFRGMLELGNCYNQGLGIEKNIELDFYWYIKAAEQGYTVAMNQIGQSYRYGFDTEKDIEKAIFWYLKAAKKGDRYAQLIIGELYYDGEGFQQSYAKAQYWYEKAGELGQIDAQFRLGEMYIVEEIGSSTQADYDKCIYWLRKAARQGDIRAQKELTDLEESW